MLEVEVKYRNADRTAAVATLLDWGATLAQDRTDVDLYFAAPDRDLKATDEAFRLRRIGAIIPVTPVPLACAAGIASIREMQRLDLPQQAAEKGEYFVERLEEINAPVIREVRGRGLLSGVELKTKVAPYLRALQAEGVLALPAGMNVLRFLPPAVITHQQIDAVVEKTANPILEILP